MQDLFVALFSRLRSKDALIVVGGILITGMLTIGVVCISGYDLRIDTTGLSCTKHDRIIGESESDQHGRGLSERNLRL